MWQPFAPRIYNQGKHPSHQNSSKTLKASKVQSISHPLTFSNCMELRLFLVPPFLEHLDWCFLGGLTGFSFWPKAAFAISVGHSFAGVAKCSCPFQTQKCTKCTKGIEHHSHVNLTGVRFDQDRTRSQNDIQMISGDIQICNKNFEGRANDALRHFASIGFGPQKPQWRRSFTNDAS